MVEFKSAMVDFLKFQHEQQNEWELKRQEKQLEQQKRLGHLQLDIQEERLEIQKREEERLVLEKQTEIRRQKIEEILLQTQQEQRNLLELINRGQISENENAFSQNTIWSSIDNFTCSPDEDITITSYFRRFEDLYATDCVNWVDSKKFGLLL